MKMKILRFVKNNYIYLYYFDPYAVHLSLKVLLKGPFRGTLNASTLGVLHFYQFWEVARD